MKLNTNNNKTKWEAKLMFAKLTKNLNLLGG